MAHNSLHSEVKERRQDTQGKQVNSITLSAQPQFSSKRKNELNMRYYGETPSDPGRSPEGPHALIHAHSL